MSKANKLPALSSGSTQKTLFSFFSKAAAVTPAPKETASNNNEILKTALTTSQTTIDGNDSSSQDKFHEKPLPVKKKRVLEDEDDDEEENKVNVKKSVINNLNNKKIKKLSTSPQNDLEEEDEEWSEGSLHDSSDHSDSSSSDDMDIDDDDVEEKHENKKKPPRYPTSTKVKKTITTKAIIASTAVKTANPKSLVSKTSASENFKIFGTPSNAHLSSTTTTTVNKKDDQSMDTPDPSLPLPEGVFSTGTHEHHSWSFLKPSNRKDKNGRDSNDPLYDPRSLSVPAAFLKDLSPGMKQWMDFKKDNMDTVLFFKVGKFYELYHMDADIGMQELDLIYMKGPKAHSGFPEVSYGKYANILVNKGYKVARIEQTETPDMLKERNDRSGGKKDKVVRREMCSILSKGTRTYCHLDEAMTAVMTGDDNIGTPSSVLLCIVEKMLSAKEDSLMLPEDNDDSTSQAHGHIEYGICAVDTILSTVTFAQFEDDQQLSRLRTLLARFTPTEVIVERAQCCQFTMGTLSMLVPTASIESLSSAEILLPDQSLDLIEKEGYFQGTSSSFPDILQAIVEGNADGSSSLMLRALGGVLFQLKRCCIDYEIMSAKKFFAYIPPDLEADTSYTLVGDINNKSEPSSSGDSGSHLQTKHMVLDAVALSNLEVLVNNFDRTEKGSLWSFVNRSKTAFGRRQLREWLCKPLVHIVEINARRGAIEDLMNSEKEAETVRNIFKKLPDIERLLSRVHCNGLLNRSTTHPDARAVFFEPNVYSIRKIRDFADVLKSFESLVEAMDTFEDIELTSPLLISLVKMTPIGKFPNNELKKQLSYYRSIFDEKQAKKDGVVVPKLGISEQYDKGVANVKDITIQLENHLKECKRVTGISSLTFFGSNKDRFQIEVPMANINKVPADWTTKSQKKTHRRYYTPTIERLFEQLQDAETSIAAAQKDTLRSIFEKFDSKSLVWFQALEYASTLDALLALATVSSSPGYCWPDIKSSPTPMLHIVEGRHPMLDQTLCERGDGAYIPNTVILGSSAAEKDKFARLMLVSGPNMGGKSTLLRQTCLITILAQLGCKVPATECIMTPVDRIFTRVGASDRILSGQSTFFVELAETASILLNATSHSLCILDELGRGTATFDGTAIAHAVVDYLVSRKCCRALFATHYHSLVDDWEMDPRVSLGHMDCIVQVQEEQSAMTVNDPETVTFLYKLCSGSSPRSYGINVAKLAKLPDAVVQLAMQHSKEFELKMRGDSDESSLLCYRDFYVKYFERLVSIVNSMESRFSDTEFIYFTQELWRRFKHTLSFNHKI